MANLIAVMVSLAISAMAAATGIYYAGAAFSASGGKIRATQIIEFMQQINQAWYVYDGDGGSAADLKKLTQGGIYLSSAPSGVSGLTTCLLGDVGAAAPTCAVANLTTHFMVNSTGGVPGTYVALDGTNTNSLSVCTEAVRMGGQCTTNQIAGGTCTLPTFNVVADFATYFPVTTRMGCAKITGVIAAINNFGTFGLAAGGLAAGDANNYIVFLKH